MDYINKILCGNDLEILPQLPAESVNCITCSPPYWGLRDYGIEPVIWDGDKNCKHKWMESKIAGDIRFRGENSIVGSERNLNIYPIKHRPNETNPGKEGWYKDKGGLSKNPSQSSFCSLCGAWCGSLGLEPTFELYIKHLCDIFDEVKRVLRKDGTCFVNIGDTYASSPVGNFTGGGKEFIGRDMSGIKTSRQIDKTGLGVPTKSLCLIPQRFAIEMVNRGWILRNTIIWHKPNCMPSSAKDRYTVDFEYVYFFTKNNKAIFWTNEKTLNCVGKQPEGIKGIEGIDWRWGVDSKGKPKKISLWTGHDYWFEQQFEEHLTKEYRPDGIVRNRIFNYNSKLNKMRGYKTKKPIEEVQSPQHHGGNIEYGTNGRNKRAVWTISTKPFPEAHFAVFPETLIEPIIQAGCPRYVCKKCGLPRMRIYESNKNYHYIRTDTGKLRNKALTDKRGKSALPSGREYGKRYKEAYNREYTFKDYTDCGCNAGFESGVILDPFMGAGTTALVARKQGKRFLGIELKEEYIEMSIERLKKISETLF